ncbi:hypothetical protein V2W23_14600, partial [Staphylococcus gallinarum]|uniref:hypothetical protein n=1 Tax=Staphylococcus gallinarum TaxID=1293 RepID=UPI003181BDBF
PPQAAKNAAIDVAMMSFATFFICSSRFMDSPLEICWPLDAFRAPWLNRTSCKTICLSSRNEK